MLTANSVDMKKLVTVILLCAAAASAEPAAVLPSLHPQSLLSACGNVLIFAAIGIIAAIVGFKVFDLCTPGDLQKEIIEHRNVAAAIVAAAAILGVSIIIAASILG